MNAVITLLLLVTQLHQVFSFSVTSLSYDYKKTICASNQGQCTSYCGGQSNTKFNECNVNSLKFSCECIDPTIAPYANAPDSKFEVNIQQCFGDKQQCKKDCLKSQTGGSVDLCQYNECDLKFNCGSDNGGELQNFRVPGGQASASQNDESSSTSHLIQMISLQIISVALIMFAL